MPRCQSNRARTRLQRLGDRQIDMVLLDVRLPGMSGLETLDEIRKRARALPVLLLTAYADLRQAVVAMKSGADDYLAKPVDLEELQTAICDALLSDGQRRSSVRCGSSATSRGNDL